LLSEPTPSPRLWAASPDATPGKLCEYYYESFSMLSQLGTFYLAVNRNFLFGSDMSFVSFSTLVMAELALDVGECFFLAASLVEVAFQPLQRHTEHVAVMQL
jgi:hypothetical protein